MKSDGGTKEAQEGRYHGMRARRQPPWYRGSNAASQTLAGECKGDAPGMSEGMPRRGRPLSQRRCSPSALR